MPLLDTRRGKDLMGTFLSDIVLQVLSFVAENERSAIRQRQAEGIAEAKKKGTRFGRPRKPVPEGFQHQYQRWREGKTTLKEAAKACGMPLRVHFMRRGKRCEGKATFCMRKIFKKVYFLKYTCECSEHGGCCNGDDGYE